jgi:hypothetical protein
MIITLDGRRLADGFGPNCTLQELIDSVRSAHVPDRLVVSVTRNGRPLVEGDLDRALPQSVGDNDQIDLASGDRTAICVDALRDVAGQLDDLGRALPGIADRISAGRGADALREFGEQLDVWRRCREVRLRVGQLLSIDLAQLTHDDRPMPAHLADLSDRLRELRAAFESRDLVLLADLVRYEMPPLCRTWVSLLTGLADSLAAEPAGDRS